MATKPPEHSTPAVHPPDVEMDHNARTWAMFCHLAALSVLIGIPLGNIIGPLVVWLIKKNELPFVDYHGKESLNFQISLVVYSFICAIAAFLLTFVVIGVLLIPVAIVIVAAGVVFTIIGAIKANTGEHYRYPLTIRFIQ